MLRSLLLVFLPLLALPALLAQDPCEGFEAGFTNAPHPNGIQFTNTSNIFGSIIFFQWNFGDGTTSFLFDPVHNFPANGTYEVCLTIWSLVGEGEEADTCMATTCHEVTFDQGGGFTCDQYVASFFWEVVDDTTVVLFSTTEPVGGTHMWQFGDGGQLSGQQATHSYAAPGNYNVCLVSYIWNDLTEEFCMDSHCEVVGVGTLDCDALEPVFSATQIDGLTWAFEDISDPPAATVHWEVSDGTTATGPGFTHTFPSYGTHQVCMGASWWDPVLQDSCWSSICDNFTLGPPLPCDSLFQLTTGWSANGNTVWLMAASAQEAYGHAWEVGGVALAGASVEHVLPGPGTYTACVTAWHIPAEGSDTCWATSCDTLVLGLADTDCMQLQVDLAHEPQDGGIQFTNTSSIPGLPILVEWDLGDGSMASGNDPFHAYETTGEYDVCLTVWSLIGPASDPDTCMSSHCVTIVWDGSAGDPCEDHLASFTAEQVAPFTMAFTTTGTPDALGHHWDFGDGSSAEGPFVQHAYDTIGVHEICLTSWWWNENSLDTCWSTVCQNVEVTTGAEFCDPGFTVEFTWTQQSIQFTFEASTNVPMAGIIWDLGGGPGPTGPVVTHLYEPPGPYYVCALAWYWNEAGQDTCWAQQCQWVEWSTTPDCDPDFSVAIAAETEGMTVHLEAIASPSAEGHYWDLGDGATATGATVSHTYTSAGPFTVCVDSWYWEQLANDTCWAEACLNVDPVVAIGEPGLANGLSIHPRPASDHITINLSTTAPAPEQLELYTIEGSLLRIYRPDHWPYRIDLRGLSPGMLVLRAIHPKGSFQQRIMVE